MMMRGAAAGGKPAILEKARQRQRGLFELSVGQPAVFALAVGLDQADLLRPAL